jgi:hypothetical protein
MFAPVTRCTRVMNTIRCTHVFMTDECLCVMNGPKGPSCVCHELS